MCVGVIGAKDPSIDGVRSLKTAQGPRAITEHLVRVAQPHHCYRVQHGVGSPKPANDLFALCEGLDRLIRLAALKEQLSPKQQRLDAECPNLSGVCGKRGQGRFEEGQRLRPTLCDP